MEEENKEEENKKGPKSVLEETKELIADLKKEREEVSKVRDDLRQLRSDQLLSGSAGIHQEVKPAKEETALEYSKRVMSGGLNAKPEETIED